MAHTEYTCKTKSEELRKEGKKINQCFSVKKEYLPEKICVVCKLPFTWRRKWEKNWNEVKYCSERCRRNKTK